MTAAIRPATPDDAAGIAEVHVASWRTSYRGIVDDAYLASLDVTAQTARWTKRLAQPAQHILVAAAPDGRLVGLCSAGAYRGSDPAIRGELYAIYLLDDAKGQGTGRALFERTARWLAAEALVPFQVWVFLHNPAARAFYERMGGVLTGEPQHLVLADKPYAEVAYRWNEPL
jgi:GNAT superfamily N-acetyltransferase